MLMDADEGQTENADWDIGKDEDKKEEADADAVVVSMLMLMLNNQHQWCWLCVSKVSTEPTLLGRNPSLEALLGPAKVLINIMKLTILIPTGLYCVQRLQNTI